MPEVVYAIAEVVEKCGVAGESKMNPLDVRCLHLHPVEIKVMFGYLCVLQIPELQTLL